MSNPPLPLGSPSPSSLPLAVPSPSMSNPHGKGWRCMDCGHVNRPIVCKLTSLPPLRCGGQGCKTLSTTSYEWRLTQAIIIGRQRRQKIPIDLPIYQQDAENCGVYAGLNVVQLMWLLHFAWNYESHLGVEPNALGFAELYRLNYEATYPRDSAGNPVESIFTPNVIQLLINPGIPLKWSTHSLSSNPCRTLKIKSAQRLKPSNIEAMTEMIGNGFPLIGTVPMGRLQHLITCEQVYDAPALIPGKTTEGFHAVALIGSGLRSKDIAGSDAVHETFFVARDSNSYRAHGSIRKGKSDREKAVGGDCLVWASDVCEAWKVEILDDYLPPKVM